MAPEVLCATPETQYGFEVDVFSFGVLLYEILALELPFRGFPTNKVCELVIQGTLDTSVAVWRIKSHNTLPGVVPSLPEEVVGHYRNSSPGITSVKV